MYLKEMPERMLFRGSRCAEEEHIEQTVFTMKRLEKRFDKPSKQARAFVLNFGTWAKTKTSYGSNVT